MKISNMFRKWILVSAALVAFNFACAQNEPEFEANLWGSFGYNMTDILHGSVSGTVVWHTNEFFDLRGGLRWRSPSMLSPELVTTVKFPLGPGTLLLENMYVYQAWIGYNMQEFNTVLTVGYAMPRWRVQIGGFNKFYSNITTPFKNKDYIFEPLNFAYDFEFWLRRMERKFNAGMRLCNVEDFVAERFYSPIVTLKFNYKVRDNRVVYFAIRNHQTGIFDLTKNFYERTFLLGAQVSW